MTIFKLPDLGEGLPNAEINQWHVAVGDVVKVDQLMVSMETAKAVVDVPAPYTGKIIKLYGQAGDIINTGAPLVEFENHETNMMNKSHDKGTVAGSIVVGDKVLEESAMGVTSTQNTTQTSVKVIPALRALAKRLGVNLEQITPTGANGQITREDIERAAKQSGSVSIATTHHPERSGDSQDNDFEPLRGVRRAMALAMMQSHAEVVPVTLCDDADIQAWPAKTDITLRIIRALVDACRAEPALNAWYDGKSMSRKLCESIDLGLALDSQEGLFVPVIKDVAHQNDQTLRQTIDTFKQQVITRSIPPENLKACTIILSNFGNFAGRYANPVIVPPVVAILGTGKIRDTVLSIEGIPTVRRTMPLSLTFDHRAVTGGEAARFLGALISSLEKE